jgi:hypothetical protein
MKDLFLLYFRGFDLQGSDEGLSLAKTKQNDS